VSKYWQLVNRVSDTAVSQGAPPGADCPDDEDVDWDEVAVGLWPEFKAKQLILHAALCDHCGPLLRAAAILHAEATPQEEKLLAQLKDPSRPSPIPRRVWSLSAPWQFMRWLVPAAALMGIFGILATRPPSSPAPLSGPKLAEFAVTAYKQQAQGSLALDIRSDSQQTLNDWFKAKSPFSLALPASPAAPGEERPYRLEGARFVQIGKKSAAYIAYRMQTGPVGLMVTPDSVAVASGGIEVDFKKLSFHYGMVQGFKVVTWSVNGLTYALVSQEGNDTQQSCMVCHSAMRDRDLSHTPTPLPEERTIAELFSN
jgi:anti-sigma factor RsiW